MRFLILGCNGMAGHTVSLYLHEKGHDVTGYARRKSRFVDTIIGDAFDQKYLRGTIETGVYDSVVNCIGILNAEADSHKTQAVYLNACLPHFLEDVTAVMKTQVIQISTDCVFSGKRGQYTEDDFCDGANFYGRTKALGELENEKDFTIRTSIIGPDLDSDGIGLLNWFLQQKDVVYGYRKMIWTGITTLQLAKCVERVSKERLNGLYHMVPDNSISKYELLVLCNKKLKDGKLNILTQDLPVLDKSLKKSREKFDYNVPGYEIMVEELRQWISKHEELYPHYKDEIKN